MIQLKECSFFFFSLMTITVLSLSHPEKKSLLIFILGIQFFFTMTKVLLCSALCCCDEDVTPSNYLSPIVKFIAQTLSDTDHRSFPANCSHVSVAISLHPLVPHCGSVYRLLSISHNCLTVSARTKELTETICFRCEEIIFPLTHANHSTVTVSTISFCDPKGESNISTSMKPEYITTNSLIWIIF